jgi:FixJ family two-component response regulator
VAGKAESIIYIVDDDESVRRALGRLLRAMGMDTRLFESAQKFLDSDFTDENACLITDVKMPGLDGLGLKRVLVERGSKLPVILITGFDTEETRALAKEAGAAGYFRKPVDGQALLDSIRWAMSHRD